MRGFFCNRIASIPGNKTCRFCRPGWSGVECGEVWRNWGMGDVWFDMCGTGWGQGVAMWERQGQKGETDGGFCVNLSPQGARPPVCTCSMREPTIAVSPDAWGRVKVNYQISFRRHRYGRLSCPTLARLPSVRESYWCTHTLAGGKFLMKEQCLSNKSDFTGVSCHWSIISAISVTYRCHLDLSTDKGQRLPDTDCTTSKEFAWGSCWNIIWICFYKDGILD